MIQVKKLSKSFGSTQAVDNVSFSIKKGEIVGFLGPNGAGKTTTMRLLTGFLSPDSGSINIAGINQEEDLANTQSKIGYLPENNPLYKDMLVSEILELAADLKQISGPERAESFDFIVDAVGINNVFYRPINELSKGYKQRVGMAMALLHKPDILIMDEPTEGLDPNQRKEIRALIKELAKDRTIILSTHVMNEAAAVASRLLIINQGKIVADGTPEELTKVKANEQQLNVVLEGTKITSILKQQPSLQIVESQRVGPNRYSLVLGSAKNQKIQPQLSQLIIKNKWTVWSMEEPHKDLESVFQSLTQL